MVLRQHALRAARAAARSASSPGRLLSTVPDADKVMCAGKTPKYFKVEEGKSYFWCSCGRSKKQPLCDGSHKGTSFEPVKYTAEKSGNVKFCMCKSTGTQPICDASHLKVLLPWFFGGPKVKVGELYERMKK